MNPLVFALVAGAAVLHVTWNVMLKTAGDPLQVNHGKDSCDLTFGHVLNQCAAFLGANPGEAIFMLVNDAYGNPTSPTVEPVRSPRPACVNCRAGHPPMRVPCSAATKTRRAAAS